MQTALQTKWHYLFIDTEALNLERPNIRFTTTTNWQQLCDVFFLDFDFWFKAYEILAVRRCKNVLVTIQLLLLLILRLLFLIYLFTECGGGESLNVWLLIQIKKFKIFRANTIYKLIGWKKQFGKWWFCVWIPRAMNFSVFFFEKWNMEDGRSIFRRQMSKLNPSVIWINNGCTYLHKTWIQTDRTRKVKQKKNYIGI